MKIRGIGFDYGGVLAGMPSSQFVKELCAILSITAETFHDAYFAINHLLNKGILAKEDFFKKLLENLNKESELPEVLKFLSSIPEHQLNQQVLTLARELKSAGYKVGVFSNNTPEAAKKMRQSKLPDYFDAFIVSSEIGKLKPDPEAFRIFFERLGISPKESVYIDDSPKSLTTAKELGFQPILFTDYVDLVQQLERLGIKAKSD